MYTMERNFDLSNYSKRSCYKSQHVKKCCSLHRGETTDSLGRD